MHLLFRSAVLGLLFLMPFFVSAGDFFVPHVAKDTWTTSATFFNPTDHEITVMYTRYDTDGTNEVASGWYTVPPNDCLILSNTEYGYSGSILFSTPDHELVLKLMYHYGTSPSVCEFQIQADVIGSHWLIPNAKVGDFDWLGLAVQNPNEILVDIEISAHQDGVRLGVSRHALDPHEKMVALLDILFPGFAGPYVDYIEISSSSDIGTPVGIIGNDAQDRHVFFNAFRLYDNFYGISMHDIAATPMTAEDIPAHDDATNQLPEGAILVYETEQGRFGKLLITKYAGELQFRWVTFDSDGSIYKSGIGVEITPSWLFDLDEGILGASTEAADFKWEYLGGIERNFSPRNGLFAIWES